MRDKKKSVLINREENSVLFRENSRLCDAISENGEDSVPESQPCIY